MTRHKSRLIQRLILTTTSMGIDAIFAAGLEGEQIVTYCQAIVTKPPVEKPARHATVLDM